MTNYSHTEGHCRCDRFKPSGKWYDTFMIDMSKHYDQRNIHCAVARAIIDAGWPTASFNEEGWRFVVLEPHHRNAFPIMITGERLDYHANDPW